MSTMITREDAMEAVKKAAEDTFGVLWKNNSLLREVFTERCIDNLDAIQLATVRRALRKIPAGNGGTLEYDPAKKHYVYRGNCSLETYPDAVSAACECLYREERDARFPEVLALKDDPWENKR